MSDAITLTIAPRFCGPPGSANGGYFAGLVARLTTGLGADAPAATTVATRAPR